MVVVVVVVVPRGSPVVVVVVVPPGSSGQQAQQPGIPSTITTVPSDKVQVIPPHPQFSPQSPLLLQGVEFGPQGLFVVVVVVVVVAHGASFSQVLFSWKIFPNSSHLALVCM